MNKVSDHPNPEAPRTYHLPLIPVADPTAAQLAEHIAADSTPMVTMLALPFADKFDAGRYVDSFEPTIFDRSLAQITAGERHVSFRADGTHEGDFRSLVATTAKPLDQPGGARVWAIKNGPEAGIYAQAHILTTTQAGKDAWEVITQGIGRHVSVSFTGGDYEIRETADGRPNYHFNHADWTEVTFVDKPALTQTWLRPSMTDRKLADLTAQVTLAPTQPDPDPTASVPDQPEPDQNNLIKNRIKELTRVK